MFFSYGYLEVYIIVRFAYGEQRVVPIHLFDFEVFDQDERLFDIKYKRS